MSKTKTSFKALILLYHQVVEREYDPFCLAVSRKNFLLQMKYLKRHYHIISIERLIFNLKNSGNKTKKFIVLTFDDGYSDNYSNAGPILANLKIPATFFVSSGNINKTKLFWWDSLTALFDPRTKLPRIFKIKFNKREYLWKINPLTKQKTFFEIYSLLQHLPVKTITKIIRQLTLKMKHPEALTLPYRTMNEVEISNLAKNPLFCVGAHSHNHPFLTEQPAHTQKREIVKSKQILERIIRLPVKYFSYPYGSKGSYTAQTIHYLKENGFKVACSVSRGIVTSGINLYELPRIPVENWNIMEFKSTIEGFLSLSD
jgi:peptidoglycan/xylan/chitin deacetylase (PgdA/CDA1 family)